MKILHKIHQFATHPIGMFINVCFALEILTEMGLNNPIAILVVWVIINGITGWRVMSTCDKLYFTQHEWKRNTSKLWKWFAISLASVVAILLFDISSLLLWSSAFLGIAMVYLMRNYEYRKRYACLWIK